MPKTRQQKETLLKEFDETLAQAKGVVFVNYQGLKVSEMETLRDQAMDQSMTMRITKNTVLRLAAGKHGLALNAELLAQPLAMITSTTDEVAPAKVTKLFAKEHEAMSVAGGIVANRFLTPAEMNTLADLPSQDQLRAQLVSVIASPLIGLVRTLQAPLAGIVNVLNQYQQKRAS
ncbi:MAG: 50S ribosomal protein L10 [Patescibacteria group bacterium]